MTGSRLEEFRAQFPITAERVYLITGAIAPVALPVRAALEQWLDRSVRRPLINFDAWLETTDELRRRFAGLLGADPTGIVIADGTSRAAAVAVRLLADLPGTFVLTDPTTYPSSIYPWADWPNKRLVAASHELDAEAVSRLAGGDLAAVVVSHVAWRTGYRHDLRELADAAHADGGLLIVDAAQSAGAVPIDVGAVGVDVLMTTATKWLLGLPGVGLLYVRPDLLERQAGTLPWPSELLPRPTDAAGRLEPGLPALHSVAATNAALALLAEFGIDRLAEHVEYLAGRCIAGLSALGLEVLTPVEPRQRAGVIAVRHPQPASLAHRLAERSIDVMGRDEWGFLRVDPAGFTSADEIDLFLDEMARLSAVDL